MARFMTEHAKINAQNAHLCIAEEVKMVKSILAVVAPNRLDAMKR
jgi:hypothetical protein